MRLTQTHQTRLHCFTAPHPSETHTTGAMSLNQSLYPTHVFDNIQKALYSLSSRFSHLLRPSQAGTRPYELGKKKVKKAKAVAKNTCAIGSATRRVSTLLSPESALQKTVGHVGKGNRRASREGPSSGWPAFARQYQEKITRELIYTNQPLQQAGEAERRFIISHSA